MSSPHLDLSQRQHQHRWKCQHPTSNTPVLPPLAPPPLVYIPLGEGPDTIEWCASGVYYATVFVGAWRSLLSVYAERGSRFGQRFHTYAEGNPIQFCVGKWPCGGTYVCRDCLRRRWT